MNLLKTQATAELFFNWLSTEYLFLDLQWITEKSARQQIQVYEPECPSHNYKIEIIFPIWLKLMTERMWRLLPFMTSF